MPYGNLLADVVQSSTTGTPPQFNDGNGTQTGTLCRAWVNFNGTSGASPVIRASFNVSSVTRISTGKYTVTFTNAFANANYSFQMHCIEQSGGDRTVIAGGSVDSTAPTASALNFNTFQSLSSTLVDANWVAVAIFR